MRTHFTSRLLPLACALPAFVQSLTPCHADNETRKVSIKVVPGAIKFDTTRFDVTVGSTVELSFINECVMPHNLVIIQPEAEPSIIAAVNTMGIEGMEKNFVPNVPGIVAASKLLQPTQKELLSFTAPQKEGEYPFVCTFPGHWFTMRGIMRVRAVGAKLEAAQKELSKTVQVEDALKTSGMTHKPMGTTEKPLVMRTFAPDPGLDTAVFAHHGVGKDAFKYDPATRLDMTRVEKDAATGEERKVPIVVTTQKGVAGAIAVNHGTDFSYVWDSTECRLMYVWRGGFLDMNPYWGKEPGSGRDKMYIPAIIGHLVYRASGPMPLADAKDTVPVFLGYKMEGGIPEFRYRLGTKTFREKVLPKAPDGFEVRITPEDAQGAVQWNMPPNDRDVVQSHKENRTLVLSVKDRPEPEQPPRFKKENSKSTKS
jgi:azurin